MGGIRVNKPQAYKSSLGRLMPNKVDPEEVKRKGWRDEGIFVVSENDNRLTWPEKEFINQIATKLYGNRIIRGNRYE